MKEIVKFKDSMQWLENRVQNKISKYICKEYDHCFKMHLDTHAMVRTEYGNITTRCWTVYINANIRPQIQGIIPCGSTPLIRRFCPWTVKLPDPLFAFRFRREARPGSDNPPPAVTLLPMLPPLTILPIELVIRGPAFPKIGDTPNPGTALRLPIAAEVDRIPGIEPPTAFVLLLNPGFPTTLRPPLLVTPECPWELP